MPSTRTPGITLSSIGLRCVDKWHRGVRIGRRLGTATQEQAEAWLQDAMRRVDRQLQLQNDRRPLFRDCAARYLEQSRVKRSFATSQIHVRLLLPHIGELPPEQVHDRTLEPFVSQRIAAGASATTINRSLEVVRTILNRAARSYRDDIGRPSMTNVAPLISMLPESRRAPYPITWDEQDRLFPKLPPHLQRMAIFGVNTGLRNANLCGLEWTWEVEVPEIGRSVFVIPAEAFKSKRDHVVILNDAAWSVIHAQRGLHPIWVFPYRGRRIDKLNNTGWQNARQAVGLRAVRVHDLRHTFACRLRAAGVSAEDRSALLGHAQHSMSGHYASADVGRLLDLANLVLMRTETRTVIRLATSTSRDQPLLTTSPTAVPQLHEGLGSEALSR